MLSLIKKSFCIAAFIIAIAPLGAQEVSRRQADSMMVALQTKLPDARRIEILLTIAQYHIFKPGEIQADFDSAEFFISEAAKLNKSLNSKAALGYRILTESYMLRETGRKNEGKAMALKAVEFLQSDTNYFYLGRAYFELSMYYRWDEPLELEQRIKLVQQSVASFRRTGKLAQNAYVLEMLADLYIIREEDDKALPTLNEALAAYQSVGHQQTQGVYVLLAEIYFRKSDERQALYYGLKALKTAQELNDSSLQVCQINHLLASLYSRIDRREIAIIHQNTALQIATKHKDTSGILLCAINLAHNYHLINKADSAVMSLKLVPKAYLLKTSVSEKAQYANESLRSYTALGNFEEAKPFCEWLLTLVQDSSVSGNIKSFSYRCLAGYFMGIKQFEKAEYYLRENLKLSDSINYQIGIIHGAGLWYKLDSARGDRAAAFNHLLFHRTKMDSMFSNNRVKQLQVLGVEYETEMKEDSIRLREKDIALLTQTNNLQKATLNQANLIKNVTIIGIVLSLLISALIYRQFYEKQKSNTIIINKNSQLEHLLDEKEWLLKEIHHRVKNNLQIVMSLLNSQSAHIDNPFALTAIHDSQHRVHAMSLIHQKLYLTDNVSSIDMSVYIREMISYLTESFNIKARIRFDCNVDPLQLDVTQAVPLGLILNEAITNAIKYAFPDNRTGNVSILLYNTSSDRYILQISDNGIGISFNNHQNVSDSLGMSLMKGLTEDLDGVFSITSNHGTTVNISFKAEKGVRGKVESLVNNN